MFPIYYVQAILRKSPEEGSAGRRFVVRVVDSKNGAPAGPLLRGAFLCLSSTLFRVRPGETRRARWYIIGPSAICGNLSCDVTFTTIYRHMLSCEVVPYF